MSGKKGFLLLLMLVLVAAPACGVTIVDGSGDLVTETREVRNFDRIDLSGSGQVLIAQGEGESLTIETDDNVMAYIEAKVERGTLKLGFKQGFRSISPTRLLFTVGVDDLSGLAISGSGEMEADSLETEVLEASVSGSGEVLIDALQAGQVDADISGSGEIRLGGEAATQVVAISGSGKYLAGELCSPSVRISVSGSGDATVCALDTLNAEVSGSGNVGYYGEPSVNMSSSGSGNVNRLGGR